MAQTPVLLHKQGRQIDYTFSEDAAAGDVIVLGSIPMIVERAVDFSVNPEGTLCADGIWKVPQVEAVITAGDAVYWDADGSPYGGTASSGCATGTAANGDLMGTAVFTTASTDTYVYVMLTAVERAVTVAGAVTATDITGSDSTLAIAGYSAAQGGLVSVTGALSTTTGNAGGAASLVGGVGGATGAGGAAVVTGGASGATSGTGGAATITGGAAGSAAGNAVGGAASITGGIGKGNLAGGAASVVGGLGGPSGAGGAIAITSGQGGTTTGAGGVVGIAGGAGGATTGDGGAVTMAGGAATANNSSGGALTLNGGAKHGTGADGAIVIGSTAASVTFGKMPRVPVAAVTAAGTVIGNAAACAEGVSWVTGANNTAGVQLPTAVAGAQCVVINNGTAEKLLVYPTAADTINALGANNAINMAANTVATFVAVNGVQWFTLPLLPS